MIVNQANAAVVAAIFASLSDARFSMRTPGAMIKNTTVTEAEVLDVSAQIGLEFKRRIRDGALLIERPATVTAEQALEISQKAQALLLNDGAAREPFELNFAQPADIMGDVEDNLDGTGEDE